jgi:hypothetical protein
LNVGVRVISMQSSYHYCNVYMGNILVVNHWPKLLSDSFGRVYRRKHSKKNVGEYSDVTNPASATCMGQVTERENTFEH